MTAIQYDAVTGIMRIVVGYFWSSEEGSAHAYSVRKLSRHEIANTIIGGRPIAAGY